MIRDFLAPGLRRTTFGAAASLVAALVLWSCGEVPTQPGIATGNGLGTADTIRPTLRILVAGPSQDTVDLNAPLNLTVEGRENGTFRFYAVEVFANATRILLDSASYAGAQNAVTRNLTAGLVGRPAGTVLRVLYQARDGADNRIQDSLRIQTIDTIAPVASLTSPQAGTTYVRRDSVQIDVSSSDGAGVARVAWIIRRVRVVGDTVPYATDSAAAPATPTATSRNRMYFRWSDTATAGNYVVQGRVRDHSGNVTLTAPTPIVLRDQSKPALTVYGPAADTVITAGDTELLMRARGTDNVGLRTIKFWGFTVRGDPKLGPVDTLMRYDTAYAPAVRIGGQYQPYPPNVLTDSVVRRMNPVNHGSVPDEPIILAVRVTDESGNDSTIYRRARLVTTAFTQDTVAPVVTIQAPDELSNITVGSSFTVRARIQDNFGLRRLSVVGITTRGDPDLGRVDTVVRYPEVAVPNDVGSVPGSFRTGLTDTTVTRLMVPAGDQLSDTLRLIFRLTDVTGRETVVVRRVRLLQGPTVTLTSPAPGAVVFPGSSITVRAEAKGPSNLIEVGYRVANPNWNDTTKLELTAIPTRDTSIVRTVTVPDNVVAGSVIRVVPFARDQLNPSVTVYGDSITLNVQVPAQDRDGPLVYQTMPRRVEVGDSVRVRAIDPSRVSQIGFRLYRSDNVLIDQGTVSFTGTGRRSDTTLVLPLSRAALTANLGRQYKLVSFAIDTLGNRGNSVPAGSAFPDSVRADTAYGVIAYGRTFRTANLGGTNVAGDIAVAPNGTVFISNINNNWLERWTVNDSTFKSPVRVGAQPWGLAFSKDRDTLLVANSGGTNLSVVNATAAAPGEIGRIQTPNTYYYKLVQAVDENTGVVRFTLTGEFSYSDRPQYVAMTDQGHVFYSTRPTTTAPAGTIRRLDFKTGKNLGTDTLETQQVVTYGEASPSTDWFITNVLEVKVKKSTVDTQSDTLEIWDRQYARGTLLYSGKLTKLDTAVNALRNMGSDIIAENIVPASLGLTDTTFVAIGGTRQSLAFGEAKTPGRAGRVMLVNERTTGYVEGTDYFGSQSMSVGDLTDNASDRIYGLTMDSTSSTVGVNGQQAFYGMVNPADPFLDLRLLGTYRTAVPGNGIAFHPLNTAPNTNATHDSVRVSFVMQGDTAIAIVDTYYFYQRKLIPVRTELYGPMRAELPLPSERLADPTLRVKLYAMTKEGLLVIPIRQRDIDGLP